MMEFNTLLFFPGRTIRLISSVGSRSFSFMITFSPIFRNFNEGEQRCYKSHLTAITCGLLLRQNENKETHKRLPSREQGRVDKINY